MADLIGSLGRVSAPVPQARVEPRPASTKEAGNGFRGMLGDLVADVNRVQNEASTTITQFAAGDGENLHEVLLAVSKAELSFKFLMEARNKLVDAYHEVMRMQL
jgi:flagellar hook-basal body complex protein FliE